MRPAHIHFMVTAEGYQRLITHVFVEGDDYLDSDAVFGVRSALIAPFTRDGDHWTASYDLVLAPQ
jgi:protocatechuate 3,4-dioxygenase beta subunit